jgi:hypothetical protein
MKSLVKKGRAPDHGAAPAATVEAGVTRVAASPEEDAMET